MSKDNLLQLMTHHPSLFSRLSPVDAVEGDVDAAALAVVVGDEVVADEAEREVADVVVERERVARGRGPRVHLADVHVVAEAVLDGAALDDELPGLRVAADAQAVLVQ